MEGENDMKKKLLCVSGIALILLLTVLLLAFLQALLMPKYQSVSREGSLIDDYYAEEVYGHDVLFVGDCEVYESFTPPTLWEEYGITSYIRGSAQQLSWQSYYLLEDTLRYETPKVVVFNVLSLKYGEPQDEAYNRMTLDGMKLSATKLRAINASMTEDESFVSYLFPILRFHSRWSDLGKEDFTYLCGSEPISHNGYLMQTAIKGGNSDRVGKPLVDYTLPKTSMDYLDAMRALCEEKGIELVLIKAPTNNWKYYWYDEWDAQILAYAERHSLSYYNFIPLADQIGIDWENDTYDAGVHLNVYGAEKLTSYFGEILERELGLPNRRAETADVWEPKLAAYYQERNQPQ